MTRVGVKEPGGTTARTDRAFFASFAVLIAVVIFAGFTPTFYARGSFFPLAPLGTIRLAHGVVFTVWVLLFLAQPLLIVAHRRQWHRYMGAVGAVVAAAMLVTGLAVTIALEQSHAPEPLLVLLVHLFTNVAPLLAFTAFVAQGLRVRRIPVAHKRWMLLATVILVPPATGRLLPHFGLDALNTPVYAAFAFAVAVYDRWTLGRVHPVSLFGAAFLIGLDLLVSGLLLVV